MKKKLFSILLSLAMVVTMMSMATMTALAAEKGELGYVFYTDADGSNPTETGTDKFFKFTVTNAGESQKEVKVEKAAESISGVCNIPSKVNDGTNTYKVTSISDDAFYNCASITAFSMPNTITTICSK